MQLYVIRHADAVPLGDNGLADDASRPLTELGRQQSIGLAEVLGRLGVRFNHLVTSPLVRARQTADLIVGHLPGSPVKIVEEASLAPGGKRRKLTRALRDLEGDVIGIVGHNPDLSVYTSWLIGTKKAQIELAKGATAHIEFEGQVGKGSGTLTWLVTPAWFLTPSTSRS